MFKVVWYREQPEQPAEGRNGVPKFQVGDTAIFFPGRDVTAAERAATQYKMYGAVRVRRRDLPAAEQVLRSDPSRRRTSSAGQRDHPIMRLANTYLMLAEALIRDGKPAEAVPYDQQGP